MNLVHVMGWSMLRISKGVAGLLALILIVAISLSAPSTADARTRKLSLDQLQDLSKLAEAQSNFPIVVNEEVLKWVNFYASTPRGRKRFRSALTRMETFRPTIEKRLNKKHAPVELMAIPVIETGYVNFDPSRNPNGAAGLWQFMAGSARKFGLRVDQKVDERLDVGRSTDAAVRLLKAYKKMFGDWELALLAYNVGEVAVERAIRKTGSNDAWDLVRSGALNKETTAYLPKLNAAILLMRHPQLLN